MRKQSEWVCEKDWETEREWTIVIGLVTVRDGIVEEGSERLKENEQD